MAWRRPFSERPAVSNTVAKGQMEQVPTAGGQYISEEGGNDAPPTYQDASGAPIENKSPLGYSFGPITIILLNITMMIGAGIYSTPSSILSGTGSIGVSLIYWTLGYLLCLTSGAVYLEFTAYFPSRSGSEVVFLEQTYPNPKWLFPTTFAVQSVILSFGGANATVMAQYLIAISGHEGTDWQIKDTALACYSLATLTLVFNTKYAYWFSNAVGIVKICALLFVIVTGFVVLGGNTKVENPKANFQDVWSGSSTASAYGFTTALYRIIFSYGGYNNAFNVANEVKNPVRSLKIYATAALTTVYVLYMFANIAFFAAVPKNEIEDSNLTTATLFFEKLYLLVMPWYPPEGSQYAGDVSFWYATYAVTGIGILLACATYYWFWAFLIPKWKGYKLRQELINLDGGVQSNRLKKIPNAEVAEWDATHYAAGRLIESPFEEIQVLGKVTKTSPDDSRSYAYGAKKDPNTIQDAAYV